MGLDAPPTITNIWKEHMAEAGVDTTGATYWNVGRKGALQLLADLGGKLM